MTQVIGGFSYVTMNGISVNKDNIAICGRYVNNATIDDVILHSDYQAFYLASLQDCDVNIPSKFNADSSKIRVPNVVGDLYQWYEISYGIITGATSNIYTIVNPGTYYCVITRGACTIQTISQTVFRLVGISSDHIMEIYPNPAHDNLTIILSDDTNDQNLIVTIIDELGRTEQQENIISDGSGVIQININNNVVAGTYFINIKGNEINYSKTIIVE